MYTQHLSIEEIEQLIQQKGPAEDQSHVENCQRCQSLLEESQAFSAKLDRLASLRIEVGRAMNCPDERVWFDVAGGTLPEAESPPYAQHAAECPSCGQKLRAAIRMFEEELSPEENRVLEALPSSDTKRQRELAERLAGTDSTSVRAVVEKPKRSFWKPFSFSLAGAAVAISAVLIFISVNRHDSPADVAGLLAQAYTEDRTIEMRVPGAKHAEIRQQRGGDASSILSLSRAAREAADKISAGLKKEPANAQWLVLQAQLELLDWRYKAALSILDGVEATTDSTDFLLIRALALDEQGEMEHDPQSKNEAVDLLGRILQKEPENTVALFNQASICEGLRMYECALKDWQSFLKIEKDSSWVLEANRHLGSIQGEKKTGL